MKNIIITIRNRQVILDKDLSKLYNVKTKALNQIVKRNIKRFPNRFMFKLNTKEFEELVTNCDRFKSLKHSSNLPNAFTEQGIAMLSGLLKSEIAIETSIRIMDSFVAMRKFLSQNANYFQKFEQIDNKLLEHDNNFNKIFKTIENNQIKSQGIFYNGQVFDAYKFIIDLIKKSNKKIILIDNYIDETTLTILSNKNKETKLIIYTKSISKNLQLSIDKFKQQYNNIEIKITNKFHDRFLIIDNETYHIGASLKDLGKKIFAFSKFEEELKWTLD